MIVITGASDGLGKALAKLYSESGKKVVNLSRTDSEFAEENINCDLTDTSQIEQAARDIESLDEELEVLINCAGVYRGVGLSEISEKFYDNVFNVNVKGPIILISELINKIVADKSDIVNVSSILGTKGALKQSIYGTSKWAIRGFTKNLQEEFKGLPNRVISYCPGGFKSNIFEKATGQRTELGDDWMNPEDLALNIKQILDLPKNIEVSEIIVNRKKVA